MIVYIELLVGIVYTVRLSPVELGNAFQLGQGANFSGQGMGLPHLVLSAPNSDKPALIQNLLPSFCYEAPANRGGVNPSGP